MIPSRSWNDVDYSSNFKVALTFGVIFPLLLYLKDPVFLLRIANDFLPIVEIGSDLELIFLTGVVFFY